MSHTHPRPMRLTAALMTPPSMTQQESNEDALAMRQLRHQTKNALQRIIAQIAGSDLRATQAGATLADEIERRICLSARVSDALFGLTACPEPLRERLTALCDATVKLLADQEQTIQLDVAVTGSCPPSLEATVVRIAYEMVSNAVKHGMHMRLVGRIALRVRSQGNGSTVLLVSDNGWGLGCDGSGEGLPIMRCLAEQDGGRVSIDRVDGWTVASLTFPPASFRCD